MSGSENKKGSILIVDDDDAVRGAIRAVLETFDYDVVAVASGQEAMAAVCESMDVVILDINMPGMDGFATLKQLNERGVEIPVLFLTGAGSMDNAVKALGLGAYDFLLKPIDDLGLFRVKICRAVEKRMYVRRDKAYKEQLEAEVKAKTRELAEKNKLLEKYSRHLEEAALNIMLTLQTAMEEKDGYTAGHTVRVTEYALKIGQAMQLLGEDLQVLERAAQLHDIGKLVIDTSSIRKPGPLSDKEWDWVKKHPEVGRNIVKHLGFLRREEFIIRHHHERVDGRGYPSAKGRAELDVLTRIITVADSYDAMTSRRDYKPNKTKAEAIDELRRCADTQFDPAVVEIFVAILESDEEQDELIDRQ